MLSDVLTEVNLILTDDFAIPVFNLDSINRIILIDHA